MSLAVTATATKVASGTCPHGLPRGACPICNGSGGGGGSSVKKSAPKANEMSWDECYAVWQEMKAQKQVQLDKANLQSQVSQIGLQIQQKKPFAVSFAGNIANFSNKIGEFVQSFKSAHPIMAKPLAFIANNLLIPALNLVKNAVNLVQNAANFIKEKLADIQDKLNAVFGELKNSLEEKFSKKFNNFKKKMNSLFSIFEPKNADDEEKKIEETEKRFSLKKMFQNIRENFTYKKEEIDAKD